MRFVKSRTDYDCAPIAILNAIKWSNRLMSIGIDDHYDRLLKECKTKEDGTYDHVMEKVLIDNGKRFGFGITKNGKMIDYYDPVEVGAHILNGGAAIIGHLEMCQIENINWRDAEMHWSFWCKNKGKGLVSAVNFLRTRTVQPLDLAKLYELQEWTHLAGEPTSAYLIEREDYYA